MIKMRWAKSLGKLNQSQIKAVSDLLLEIGKWLLLSVVFSTLFIVDTGAFSVQKVIGALVYALVVIIVAIFLLKGIEKDG